MSTKSTGASQTVVVVPTAPSEEKKVENPPPVVVKTDDPGGDPVIWAPASAEIPPADTRFVVGAQRPAPVQAVAVAPQVQGAKQPGVANLGEYDYVVVGSGAGGAPLAARLALAGYRVCVLEAGSAAEDPANVIASFHALASELGLDPNKKTAGDAGKFLVTQDGKIDPTDPNYVKPGTAGMDGRSGIDMPRGWGLGGSPEVNAMITKLPPPSEWQHIYEETGDEDWKPENMRRIWETAVEHNDSHPILKALDSLGKAMHLKGLQHIQGHGFDGWLDVSAPGLSSAMAALQDKQLSKIFFQTLKSSAGMDGVGTFLKRMVGSFDDNNSSLTSKAGFSITPEAMKDGVRSDPGEHLKQVQAQCELMRAKSGGQFQGRVDIKTGALATKIDFDAGDPPRATGVEVLAGDHLYEADNKYDPLAKGTPAKVTAKNEVIVSAGTFNSPQLLMLSGIGPAEELKAANIPLVKDRPGVGTNLQDRFEVGVVSQYDKPFQVLKDAQFTADPRVDPAFKQWVEGNGGIYATDGVAVAVAFKSKPTLDKPDVYIFGTTGDFQGYHPDYSLQTTAHKDRWTWVVLDANQNNAKGTLTLNSADPTKQPVVNKHSFDSPEAATNLESTAAGVEWVRKLNEKIGGQSEVVPGTEAQQAAELTLAIADVEKRNPSDANLPVLRARLEVLQREAKQVQDLEGQIQQVSAGNPKDPRLAGLQQQLADLKHVHLIEWIKQNAWGHHPTGTDPMGTADDKNAVVDSNFKVIGTQGLRVVDQSSVKDIQGLFPVADLYIRSELAAEKVLRQATQDGKAPPVGNGTEPPPLWTQDRKPTTAQSIALTRGMFDTYFGNRDGIPNDQGPGKLWWLQNITAKFPLVKDLPGVKDWNGPRMHAFQEALSSVATISPAAETLIPPSYRDFYKMMKAEQAQKTQFPIDKITESVVTTAPIGVTDPISGQRREVSPEIFYQRWDPPDGVAKKDVVVISPAYQGTGRQWTDIAADLAKKGNTVLVMDNEYAGLSRGSPGKLSGDSVAAGIALMLTEAQKVREADKLPGQVRVLGESLSAGSAYAGVLEAYNGKIELPGRKLPPDNVYVGMINPYLGKTADPALDQIAKLSKEIKLPSPSIPAEAAFTNVYRDDDARKRFDQLAMLENVQVNASGLVDASASLQHAMQAVKEGKLTIPPNVSLGILRTEDDASIDRSQTDQLEVDAGKSLVYEQRILNLKDHALVLNTAVHDDILALAEGKQASEDVVDTSKPVNWSAFPPANAPNDSSVRFWGGTKQVQDLQIGKIVGELDKLQGQLSQVNGEARDRTFHKEGQAFPAEFTLVDHPDLPPGVPPVGIFDPNLLKSVTHVTARLSYGRGDNNTNSLMPDVRGLAVRFETADGKKQDFTGTNAEVPFFKDPAELTAFGIATKDLVSQLKDPAHPIVDPAKALLKYVPDLAAQLQRLEPWTYPDGLKGKLKATERATAMLIHAIPPTTPTHSLSSTAFWSGAPIRFGDKLVKFMFRPVEKSPGLPSADLFKELGGHPEVKYELCVQFYTDPKNTPLDPPSHWNSPMIKMGELTVNTSTLGTDAQKALQGKFDQEGFNPGNALPGNEPFGLNEQRATLYSKDFQLRGGAIAKCPYGYG